MLSLHIFIYLPPAETKSPVTGGLHIVYKVGMLYEYGKQKKYILPNAIVQELQRDK
jgi:hypothetical protein